MSVSLASNHTKTSGGTFSLSDGSRRRTLFTTSVVPLFLFEVKPTTLTSRWLSPSRTGARSGSTSRTRRLGSKNLALLPLTQ
jgi:hypothetical protein